MISWLATWWWLLWACGGLTALIAYRIAKRGGSEPLLRRIEYALIPATDLARCTDPGFDVFYGAGTLIVICARRPDAFAAADCWLAAENLMLAAAALGLGTCCVGAATAALNSAEMRLELAIPPVFTPVAPIVVGVPATPSSPLERRVPDVIAWK